MSGVTRTYLRVFTKIGWVRLCIGKMDASKAGSMLTSEPENASGMLNVCSYIYTIGIGGKFGGNRNVWRKRMHEDFGEEKLGE